MNKSHYYHDRATWRKYWQETRSHWSMMRRCGSWNGKAQFFGEWKRIFRIEVFGKSGKKIRDFQRSHVGKWNRYEVAEAWSFIKSDLKPGQRARITLNGKISRDFTKKNEKK